MYCPKCGSENVKTNSVVTTQTNTRTKGFGWIKACLGWLLFSVPGILCGLCGMGKSKTTTTQTAKLVNQCQNCGHRF